MLAIRPSNTDAVFKWGMDCPDCIYMGAGLRGGDAYRLWGNRGSARYVGLQTMAGMATTANVLLDEIERDADGNFEMILSPDEQPGNWMKVADNATALVIRHFFYDWDTEVASSLSIEQIAGPEPAAASARAGDNDPRTAMARQLVALGDFVEANLDFFLQFARPERAEHVQPSVRRHRDGRGRREPSGDGIVAARSRRGARGGGGTAAGSLLELLARQPVVGDHRLRAPPVEPQRSPGRRRR